MREGERKCRGDLYLPRQQVASSKESSKYAGCGILKRNFYTRFIPENYGFGAVTWWKRDKTNVSFENMF